MKAYLTCAVNPEDDDKNEGDSFCDLCSRKSFYNDIVPERLWIEKNESFDFDPGFFLPIIADDHHAEDRAYAGDGACEGVDVTPELAPPFIGNQYI